MKNMNTSVEKKMPYLELCSMLHNAHAIYFANVINKRQIIGPDKGKF